MPAWWLNLQAHPATTVQIGRERLPVVARVATTDERARLWPQLVEMYPDYAVYETRTERQIPVVILSPA
jgi:deazaflavin-dependent oxidoreductase (nitroreductase family)